MPTYNSPSLHKKGFTIIELLVVIVIIGLLTTVATVNYTAAQQRSRDNNRKAQVYTLSQAVEAYYGAKKDFPGLIKAPVSINPNNYWGLGFLRHCATYENDGGSYSMTYYYFPTTSTSAPRQPYLWWRDCAVRSATPITTNTAGVITTIHDPAWYKPFGSWIPGLSDYLNPQPIETRYKGYDGTPAAPIYSSSSPGGIYIPGEYCNMLAANCTVNGTTISTSANVTQTIAYKHLASGYAIFTRLEGKDADVLPVNTILDNDEPKMPTATREVKTDNIFMVRK